MKYLRKFESVLDKYKSDIDIIKDVFQDIADEGYELNILPHTFHTNGDVLYQIDINLTRKDREFESFSINSSMVYIIVENINRLEKMGYELSYKIIENTIANNLSMFRTTIQIWSRKK